MLAVAFKKRRRVTAGFRKFGCDIDEEVFGVFISLRVVSRKICHLSRYDCKNYWQRYRIKMSSYPTDLADHCGSNEDEKENEDEDELEEENEKEGRPFLLAFSRALATIPFAPHMQACTFAI